VVEICAGAGGQSLGLEAAGFEHVAAVDNDSGACATLRLNRPAWRVIEDDVANVSGAEFVGVDLLAGGVPCPPFSIAGKQLGPDDERDLFPQAIRLVREVRPKAVLLENVKGFSSARFADYRSALFTELAELGYVSAWRVLNASDYGVPQLRPRFIMVALRQPYALHFTWPEPCTSVPSVGKTIGDLVAAGGWPGARAWQAAADGVAPTVVGGSKKHGGPDLGPTRAREDWKRLGVDGLGLADAPPNENFPVTGFPRLTVRMAARIQGFPDSWRFSGGKTSAYRQVGNAFPPPVAAAIGRCIATALSCWTESAGSSLGQLRLMDSVPVWSA
jgi:DNA (cytosine-5)-methyltransferase 1